MLLRNLSGPFRVLFLLLVLLVAAFLWPQLPAWADVGGASDTVRVGIAQQMPEVRLSFQGRYKLVDAHSGDIIAETLGGETWTVAFEDDHISLARNGDNIGVFKGSVLAEEINATRNVLSGGGTLLQRDSLARFAVLSAGSGVHYLNDFGCLQAVDESGSARVMYQVGLNLFSVEKYGRTVRYRGSVEIRPDSSGLTVINELPLEQYLYGVVPSEMPTSFPQEALKAQAVVSRSYVITQLGSYGSQGFDVLDDQQSQVYRGYDGEHPLAAQAVDETAGKVLVYRGQPVAAFFHASSGGYTEDSEDVWDSSLGYIRAKKDPMDHNAKCYNWKVVYSADQLTSIVNERLQKFADSGTYSDFSVITDLKEVQHTTTGQRVKRLLISGYDSAGNPVQVAINNADQVRIVLGLNSSLFTMQKDTDANGKLRGVVFTGSGLGHGLGMSQWGASGLARKGYNYQDILQYYYTGVDLVDKN